MTTTRIASRKGGGKRGHNVADTNVSPFARARNICCGHKKCFWFLSETICVRNKCFPVCPCAQHLLRTQKMFLIFVRNILCPQQMFPHLRGIHHFHIFHNTPCLPPKIVHKYCFQFLLGWLYVLREIENNAYAKFWGANKVYYGRCESGEWTQNKCFVSRSFAHPSWATMCPRLPPP